MINPFTGNRFENNDHFLVQFLLALVFVFLYNFKACLFGIFMLTAETSCGGGRRWGRSLGGSVT